MSGGDGYCRRGYGFVTGHEIVTAPVLFLGVEKGREGGSCVGFFRLVESPSRFGGGM